MALVTSGLVAVSGCDPRSLAYFLQPFQSEIPPPEGSPVLEGKKVVILCNVTSAAVAEYRHSSGTFPGPLPISCARRSRRSRSSSRQGFDLGGSVTPAIPSRPTRGFRRDVAIFLEVEQFQSQSPGDLKMVHGDSKVHIRVFELDYPKNSRKPSDQGPAQGSSQHL